MLLIIDNYDSFTYNLVQYFEELGKEVRVCFNDRTKIYEIAKLHPECIVLSPGPCTPTSASVSLEVVSTFSNKIPIFGVCPWAPEYRSSLWRSHCPSQRGHAR